MATSPNAHMWEGWLPLVSHSAALPQLGENNFVAGAVSPTGHELGPWSAVCLLHGLTLLIKGINSALLVSIQSGSTCSAQAAASPLC
jgi:hypothetical protein